MCCSIRDQLLGLEESSCCSLQNAHFQQSSFLCEETHRQREARVQATFSSILCVFGKFFKADPRTLLESALGRAGIAFGAVAHPSPYLQQLV